VNVRPLNEVRAAFKIRGTAPLVQNRFSGDQKAGITKTQMAGSTTKKGQKRAPKDFDALCENAKHVSTAGWSGIPATAFRCALISSCRTAGFQMTMAKMTVFIEADGFEDDGTPLVKITEGEARRVDHPVRNKTGVIDIRARPCFDPGWEAVVRVKFDGDAFTLEDVANLMVRAGIQNGVGEGRPNSKMSAGMGWGTWEVIK
jgi:hypothetical protein